MTVPLIAKPLNFIRTNRTLIGLHILCWSLFIANEVGFIYYAYHHLAPLANYIKSYAINIGSFYVYCYTLQDLPRQFLKRVSLVILTLTIVIGYKAVGDPHLSENISRSVYFLTFAIFYRTAGYLNHYRKRAAEARMAYLQQQLQPHLLFNSLNLIYNRIEPHSESAARCVWLLSELMRYSLETSDKIEVKTEIIQIKNLIELHELRLGQIELKLFIENIHGNIIPLVLLTLIENLFKHGDLTKPASISITCTNQLILETLNHKRAKAPIERSSLGIENTKLRLDHAYGKNYTLQIHDDEHHHLKLTLPL